MVECVSDQDKDVWMMGGNADPEGPARSDGPAVRVIGISSMTVG